MLSIPCRWCGMRCFRRPVRLEAGSFLMEHFLQPYPGLSWLFVLFPRFITELADIRSQTRH